jgi:transposase, IS5 family
MKPQKEKIPKKLLFSTLNELCDPRHPLRKLGDRIDWKSLEESFEGYYSERGRPAKPIRLMVGLLLLKQMYNQSDESVVERWRENIYWQQFCGIEEFQWELPCDPSDLTYFRNRIGEEGVAVILAHSVELHGKEAKESEIVIDSTVQEKNITHPTDTKQYRKIILRCWKLANEQGIQLRRRYSKEVRKHLISQRLRKNPKKRKLADRGKRRLRTIAGILLRELERKLPSEIKETHKENFAIYRRVLRQNPKDSQKIYSLHESHVYCMSKGKEHKKYEFGTKASIAMTKTHGIIVAACAHRKNLFDTHTLPEVLHQVEAMSDQCPKLAIVDRGYRGKTSIGTTQILVPGKPPKNQSRAKSAKVRKLFRRRAAIEPLISHLKHHFRLLRCFLKGFQGDQINLTLAAAAWNFHKWMRQALIFCLRCLLSFFNLIYPQKFFACFLKS